MWIKTLPQVIAQQEVMIALLRQHPLCHPSSQVPSNSLRFSQGTARAMIGREAAEAMGRDIISSRRREEQEAQATEMMERFEREEKKETGEKR